MLDRSSCATQPSGLKDVGTSAGISTEAAAWFRVLDLPELFGNIARHLDTDSFHTLRLVNWFFLDISAPYFSITLDLDNLKRKINVETMFVLLQDIMDGRDPRKGAQGGWRRTPFDQIKALKVASGLNLYHHLSMVVPGGDMAALLDRHRQWIQSESTPQSQTAALSGAGGWKPVNSHPLWAASGTVEPPWTFWDLIAPNGHALLRHLESLEVVEDSRDQSQRAESLDRFLVRLSQKSSAANTLRSLSLGPGPKPAQLRSHSNPNAMANTLSSLTLGSGPGSEEWCINLRVLCDSICSLQVLESLKIHDIHAFDLKDFYVEVSAGTATSATLQSQGTEERSSQRQQQQRPALARSVKSLIFNSAASIRVKAPILALCPNLESLELDRLDGMKDDQMNEYLSWILKQGVTTVTALNVHEVEHENPEGSKVRQSIIAFPRLKLLHIPLSSVNQWTSSQMLQSWLRTSKRLGFFDLNVKCSHFKKDLITAFNKEAITVQSLRLRSIVEDNAAQVSRVLLWPMFASLSSLQIQTANYFAGGGFLRHKPRWNPDEHRILATLFWTAPWTRTLTSLSMQRLMDPIVLEEEEKELWGGLDLISPQILFKRMPHLETLEIQDPVDDLSFLEGLGRRPPADSTTSSELSDSSSSSSSPFRLRDDCTPERPLLKQLELVQSNKVIFDGSDPVEKWRTHLLYQFRFLTNLTLTREKDN